MSVETAFASFPELRTARLRLRELHERDVDALFPLFSDPAVMQFHGMAPQATRDETEAWLGKVRDRFARREAIRWGIVQPERDVVIGTCSFHHFDAAFRRVETGYDLGPAYWGQGIMFEAMQAVLTFGFTDLDLHRIEAIIDDANARSKALLLRLGFTYEAVLRERYYWRGQSVDEHMYRLLRREWTASRES